MRPSRLLRLLANTCRLLLRGQRRLSLRLRICHEEIARPVVLTIRIAHVRRDRDLRFQVFLVLIGHFRQAYLTLMPAHL